MYKRLTEEVIPACEASMAGKVKFVWFNVPQPWHPQSPILHEASFAVKRLDPSKFNTFCGMLFNAQPQFVDKVMSLLVWWWEKIITVAFAGGLRQEPQAAHRRALYAWG